ncbi:MAG: hypothetical protein IPP47_17250 [Bryobacterales bacterium]|nr:hypothetical protein [Bryobacterales bacterium]
MSKGSRCPDGWLKRLRSSDGLPFPAMPRFGVDKVQRCTADTGRTATDSETEGEMERLKNAGLVVCLFVVLLVIFASYFRASEIGTFFGALAGTPVLIHVFNRLAPIKRESHREQVPTAEFTPRLDIVPQPVEQVFVLRMERSNGRS